MNTSLIWLGRVVVLIIGLALLSWLAVQLLRHWAAPPPLFDVLF